MYRDVIIVRRVEGLMRPIWRQKIDFRFISHVNAAGLIVVLVFEVNICVVAVFLDAVEAADALHNLGQGLDESYRGTCQ